MRSPVVAMMLAGMVAVAYAACPNQCSGHGRCGANDKCTCYTQVNTPWGNRAMYTGADCSQRTCPLGAAPDALSTYAESISPVVYTNMATGSTNSPKLHAYLAQELLLEGPSVTVNVKVSTLTPTPQFQWKYDTDAIWSLPIDFAAAGTTDAPTAGTHVMLYDPPQATGAYGTNTQTETGIVVWFEATPVVDEEFSFTATRATGYHWLVDNDNSMHQPVECSGRGTCDTTTGRCKCITGFGGEACQRTTCPNDCSGHGVCQDEWHFFNDYMEGATARGETDLIITTLAYGTVSNYYYEAHDAHRQMGCRCDIGYRGPDCSLIECPAGTDPLLAGVPSSGVNFEANYIARDCSGRGTCDYSTGQCVCFKGFFGERCESQTNFV